MSPRRTRTKLATLQPANFRTRPVFDVRAALVWACSPDPDVSGGSGFDYRGLTIA